LHLPGGYFDKILSLEVLRYVDDLDRAFINIRKIMKENTVFVFTLTNLWSLSFFPLKYSLRKRLGLLDEKNELSQYFVTEKIVRKKLKEKELKIIRFEKLNLFSANPLLARIVKNRKWAEKIILIDKQLSKYSIINKFYDTFLIAVGRI
jgi:SAM-dependent methyltransferase